MTTTPAVHLEHLSKAFGKVQAVADVSLRVEPGEVVAFLGPNGAGKTTTMKLVLGLLRPTRGAAKLGSLDCTRDARAVKERLGYSPDEPSFYDFLTGRETIDFVVNVRGVPLDRAHEEMKPLVEALDFGGSLDVPTASYSHGTKKKLALLLALIHTPKLLLLDEPTNGLDPAGLRDMLQLVRQLGTQLGKSVVFSTHILPDVEEVCDAAIVLEQGRVVASGTLRELTGGVDRQYRLAIDPPSAAAVERLAQCCRVEDHGGGQCTVWLSDGVEPRTLFAAVDAAGAALRSLVPHRRSLEDVFLQAVRTPGRPEVPA
jgi:ABC-2 type transport system ATP-binding protein